MPRLEMLLQGKQGEAGPPGNPGLRGLPVSGPQQSEAQLDEPLQE